MQMGPALLPTPLSPACGRPVRLGLSAWLTSGEPSVEPALAGRAWRPMSSLLLPAPFGRPCQRFVTGARAGIRLSLLPASVLRKPEDLSNSRCLAQSLGRGLALSPIRACGGSELALLSITRSGQLRGLSGGFSVAPASNEPACLWPKPPACLLSAGAWTVATAILGIFPSKLQSLAAFDSGWLVSRRQVQSAPQPAFWQHSEALVFHSGQFGLWTRVDKSTARRILRKRPMRRERNHPRRVRISHPCPPIRAARLACPP